MTKVKKFWNEHKKQIIKIAGFAAGGIAAVVIGKKVIKKTFTTNTQVEVPVKTFPLIKAPDVPQALTDKGIDKWLEVGPAYVEFMTEGSKFPLKDLKELVNSITEIPDVTDDTYVWALIDINRDNTK